MDLARERRSERIISVDIARPRAIGIFGKRGSGKTTTLKRIAQAAADVGHLVVIVDPLSTIRPPGVRVHLGEAPEGDRRLWLNPTDLSPDAWLALFDLRMSDPMGIALFRAVVELNKRGGWWSINDLMQTIWEDERPADKTKEALENRLSLADSWGIFAAQAVDPLDVFDAGQVNVLDLGKWDPGPQSLRNLAVRLLADRLFQARMEAWRGLADETPPALLAIDEAHNFAPANLAALARPTLVRWAKEGRQPHASILVATQQPSALDFAIVSQCDLVVIHHLTLADDIRTVARLAASYAADLPAWLKGVNRPGEAIILDDIAERAWVGRVILDSEAEV